MRGLALVVGGHERANDLLKTALRASDRSDLPREALELCAFARAHLTYGLIEELGPRLAVVVLDELTRELLRREENVPPTHPDDDQDDRDQGAAVALARVQTAQNKVTNEIVSGVRRAKSDRARVAILEPNAFVRASLSRALVRAGFDVAAIETLEALHAEDGHQVVLVSMRGADLDASFAAVLALDPPVEIVAYFADETNLGALRRAGATHAVVVSALSPLDQVVASVTAVIEARAAQSHG